jgi:alpha-L-fucosidase
MNCKVNQMKYSRPLKRKFMTAGNKNLLLYLILFSFLISCKSKVEPPEPYGALPSERQLKWHEMEFYGFLHFTVNTFTDKEWGYGDEDPAIFNPVDFDADQIVSTARDAGMNGLILTCKHHDGFCLWPSKYTEHSVKNSPWKDGKGDVVREISDACKKYGLKFGVYLSPWDRNHKDYGTPEYIAYSRNQMKELLTEYGPVYEVWFDGANGGTGYYGGAKEERKIDRSSYYDWDSTWKLVRKLQPDACMFSDVGPDVRWIGNERGIANDTCWATLTPEGRDGKKPGPGISNYRLNPAGTRNGKYWIPGECDVSIRPGWFYHQSQDSMVRSPENLVDLYFKSIGRGANFLLNIPPDKRGVIHENDVKALKGFRETIDRMFAKDLTVGAKVSASNVRGGSGEYNPANVADGNRNTYWSCDDTVKKAEIILEFDEPVSFNIVSLREYLPLGQRIYGWTLDSWKNGKWETFAQGASIGNRRLWRGENHKTTKVRLRITNAPVCPAVSEFGLYLNEK